MGSGASETFSSVMPSAGDAAREHGAAEQSATRVRSSLFSFRSVSIWRFLSLPLSHMHTPLSLFTSPFSPFSLSHALSLVPSTSLCPFIPVFLHPSPLSLRPLPSMPLLDRRLNCIQTDHKAVMAKVESSLHALHEVSALKSLNLLQYSRNCCMQNLYVFLLEIRRSRCESGVGVQLRQFVWEITTGTTSVQ